MKLVLLILAVYSFIKVHFSYKKSKALKTYSKTHSRTAMRSKFKSLFSFKLSSTKSNLKLNFLNTKEKYQGYAPIKVDPRATIGPGPTYSQGWLQFFILTQKSKDDNSSKRFLLNGSFLQEKLFKDDEKFKSSNGITDPKTFIPNEQSFYFVLTGEFLFIISSRFVI